MTVCMYDVECRHIAVCMVRGQFCGVSSLLPSYVGFRNQTWVFRLAQQAFLLSHLANSSPIFYNTLIVD